jgi:flagellar biosynthesis/type III secretory pathway chaperone
MFMTNPSMQRGLTSTRPSSFENILARLNSVIAEETAVLDQRQIGELQAFTVKKNQLLFELTRALKSQSVDELNHGYIPQLKELRWRLEANRKLLGTHLDAAREIAQTIVEAIQQADSDGTYVASRGSGGTSR